MSQYIIWGVLQQFLEFILIIHRFLVMVIFSLYKVFLTNNDNALIMCESKPIFIFSPPKKKNQFLYYLNLLFFQSKGQNLIKNNFVHFDFFKDKVQWLQSQARTLFNKINFIAYFENLTVKLYVLYALNTYVKFCINQILFTI